jgi:hypothetical protein
MWWLSGGKKGRGGVRWCYDGLFVFKFKVRGY